VADATKHPDVQSCEARQLDDRPYRPAATLCALGRCLGDNSNASARPLWRAGRAIATRLAAKIEGPYDTADVVSK